MSRTDPVVRCGEYPDRLGKLGMVSFQISISSCSWCAVRRAEVGTTYCKAGHAPCSWNSRDWTSRRFCLTQGFDTGPDVSSGEPGLNFISGCKLRGIIYERATRVK